MNYEVMHGDNTHYVQAGNSWAACLDVLREEAKQGEVLTGPFVVKPLPMGEEETIPMASLLNLQYLAVNGEAVKQEKPMDLTRW